MPNHVGRMKHWSTRASSGDTGQRLWVLMDAVFSKNRDIGSFVLFGAGSLLIATGILHVTITSLLYHWFSLFVPRGLHIVGPPFLLNHLIVGVLLVSTGLTTIAGAKGDALSWTV